MREPRKSPKRYDMVTNYRCGQSVDELEPSDDGEWVRFEDVDPSVPLSAIRALVQQWRELADALTKGHTTADEQGHADGLREAADELAALCQAPEDQP